MRKEIERALCCLNEGLDEAQTRIVLREELRLSRKAAEYVLAVAREHQAALAAPKALVRRGRLAAVADAVAEEGARVLGLKEAAQDRRLAQRAALDDSFLREFEQLVERGFAGKVTVKPSAIHRKKSPPQRAVNVVLSDLHFGSNLDGAELPAAYGPHEEARRFASIMQQVADYKPQYRDVSTLKIHALGDWIQNQLHDPRDARELAAQIMAAISYGVQGIAYQAAHWRQIDVYCAPGNHDRFVGRHPGRATNQKWDSHATTIYFAIKTALAHLPNVHVHLFKTPYYVWECFGEHGFATHSDTVLNSGQPSKKIDVAGLEAQIHEMNDAFRQENKPVCRVFLHGHAHRVYWNELNTGEVIIGNGALVPPDGYAVSLGKLSASCAQVLWESVPGYMAGDFRSLRVGRKQDQDVSLEKIIKPFEDFCG